MKIKIVRSQPVEHKNFKIEYVRPEVTECKVAKVIYTCQRCGETIENEARRLLPVGVHVCEACLRPDDPWCRPDGVIH